MESEYTTDLKSVARYGIEGSSPSSRTTQGFCMSSTPLKIVFAPGAFDSFDGTQEELDAIVAEVQDMFENLTPEQLAAQSREIDLEQLAADLDLNPEVLDAMWEQTGRTRYLQ